MMERIRRSFSMNDAVHNLGVVLGLLQTLSGVFVARP